MRVDVVMLLSITILLADVVTMLVVVFSKFTGTK